MGNVYDLNREGLVRHGVRGLHTCVPVYVVSLCVSVYTCLCMRICVYMCVVYVPCECVFMCVWCVCVLYVCVYACVYKYVCTQRPESSRVCPSMTPHLNFSETSCGG